MSDFASSIALSGSLFVGNKELVGAPTVYIDYTPAAHFEQEAAGKVGKWLGVIAAIAIPFAAPAIFGAIAGSGILGAGLASAAAAGTMGTLTSVIGSAAVGGILNAGVAYASGARGGDVWRAAGMGALGAGLNAGVSSMFDAGAGAANAGITGSGGTTSIVGSAGADTLGGVTAAQSVAIKGALQSTAAAAAPTASTIATGSVITSKGIVNGITNILGNIDSQTMRRASAALVNAAVNGGSAGQLDSLVAQQRAELEALRQSDLAAYNQRISVAQQILADADRMDPAWRGRIAMADVAGMEANAARQAQRNIAVRQGGSLDKGQAKAYERGAALHTARSKALAYNQGYGQAELQQNQLRGQAAQLFGPNTAGMDAWRLGTDLGASAWDAKRQLNQSTWGGLTGALFEQDHNAATSPDPSAQQQEEDRPFGSGFAAGLRNTFGVG